MWRDEEDMAKGAWAEDGSPYGLIVRCHYPLIWSTDGEVVVLWHSVGIGVLFYPG